MNSESFVDVYHLERFILGDVRNRFEDKGFLNAFDFFCIIIWKANRAKPHMAARLLSQGHTELEDAVHALTSKLYAAADQKNRFMVLVRDWGFMLPMATAILTVLYPKEFTIYDVRACDVLEDFHRLANRVSPETMWEGYVAFRKAVVSSGPDHLSLRDKDRSLWAKAAADQLNRDIRNRFGVQRSRSE